MEIRILTLYVILIIEDKYVVEIIEPAREVSVLIAWPSSEGSGAHAHTWRLARAFAARIQKVGTYMKIQFKHKTIRSASLAIMEVLKRLLWICDKYQTLTDLSDPGIETISSDKIYTTK